VYKIDDEVVLLHITGSGYGVVTGIRDNEIEVAMGTFSPSWFPEKLIRRATKEDRIYYKEGFSKYLESLNYD